MGTELLGGRRFVTDGGLETDLIHHHGLELPDFAAFPLVEQAAGQEVLRRYFDAYVEIARRTGSGLLLETPTWRAGPGWGARRGYDARDLDRVNRAAVALLHELRAGADDLGDVLVSGTVGPRGDGYVADSETDPDVYAEHHQAQLASFADGGADLATAYTLTGVPEAIGVVRAARAAGLPVAVSFTLETDGLLPDGTRLREAVEAVDSEAPPDWFLLNCAHPVHLLAGVRDGRCDAPADDPSDDSGEDAWVHRIAGVRPNASRLSHAELDEAEELDEGDPGELRAAYDELRASLPGLQIVGGCCGTDARHVSALAAPPR